MKRPRPKHRDRASRTGDILKDFTSLQLASIGAVALAWNELEYQFDEMLGYGLVIQDGYGANVTTRLSIENKIELMKMVVRNAGLPEEALNPFIHAIGEYGRYKELRDSVIHARLVDADTAIGEVSHYKMKFSEILLSQEALENLYQRIVLLRDEFYFLIQIIYMIRRTFGRGLSGRVPNDPNIELLAQEALTWIRKSQPCRTRRTISSATTKIFGSNCSCSR